MVFFNWATMQMAAKIVYYGPGLCGKTSNLSYIYAKTSPNSRGEMVSLETESDRTLFFDLLPIEVGTIGGFKTRLQLYTVPGQVFYNTTRKLVLKGVDGLVFVADSQRPMREANLESFASLRDNLSELGLRLDDIPLVLQFNKRDLKNILTVEELTQDLDPAGLYSSFESSAIHGDGVFETLKEITKLTLKKLRKRMAAPEPAPGPAPAMRPTTATVRPSPSPERRPASISAAALARAAEEGVDEVEVDHEPSPEQPVAEPVAEVSDVPAAVTPQPEPEPEPVAAAAAELPAEPSEEPEPAPDEEEILEVVEIDEAPAEVEETTAPEAVETTPEPEPERVAAAAAEPSVEPSAEPEPFDDAAEPVPAELAPESGPEELAASETEPPADTGEPEVETDSADDLQVEFDQSDAEQIEPVELKRVHVSNQMDILAELEGLRKEATMGASQRRTTASPDLDLDSLLTGTAAPSRELRQRIQKSLNSDVFKRMKGVQLAIRIQDAQGETIHTLDPVSMSVEKADGLDKLSLQLTVNLDNVR